jgi:hypothetical protein
MTTIIVIFLKVLISLFNKFRKLALMKILYTYEQAAEAIEEFTGNGYSLISNGKPIPKKRLKYFIDDLEDLYENNHKAKYDIDIKRHLLILEYD